MKYLTKVISPAPGTWELALNQDSYRDVLQIFNNGDYEAEIFLGDGTPENGLADKISLAPGAVYEPKIAPSNNIFVKTSDTEAAATDILLISDSRTFVNYFKNIESSGDNIEIATTNFANTESKYYSDTYRDTYAVFWGEESDQFIFTTDGGATWMQSNIPAGTIHGMAFYLREGIVQLGINYWDNGTLSIGRMSIVNFVITEYLTYTLDKPVGYDIMARTLDPIESPLGNLAGLAFVDNTGKIYVQRYIGYEDGHQEEELWTQDTPLLASSSDYISLKSSPYILHALALDGTVSSIQYSGFLAFNSRQIRPVSNGETYYDIETSVRVNDIDEFNTPVALLFSQIPTEIIIGTNKFMYKVDVETATYSEIYKFGGGEGPGYSSLTPNRFINTTSNTNMAIAGLLDMSTYGVYDLGSKLTIKSWTVMNDVSFGLEIVEGSDTVVIHTYDISNLI